MFRQALLCSSLFVVGLSAGEISFNRDVRPILSDACFACHGPDAKARKAGLRLDVETSARPVLGKADDSELLRRIVSTEAHERMPPSKSARQLSAEEIATLRRWIAEGAPWEKHWAFLPPRKSDLPSPKNPLWARNPIDRFVAARLDRAGLRPAPPADKVTLLRRVTLDLTGLPPTPEEVDAFLADTRPDAYERVVDRLLHSPRFGERLAIRWLDAARYADTSGYQNDGERIMWRWRDWVIEAYNHDLPFDQFTIEQLAGDLLPNARLDQILATGFNRNHRGNAEGGIIPEEYAVEYVADRVETTATVWLGLTLTCARCHDHKYDPISQKEFYQLFAFFNNVPEQGKARKVGNSPPYVLTPTRRQVEQLAEIDERIRQHRERLGKFEPTLREGQTAWERAPGPLVADTPEKLTEASGAFGYFDRFSLEAWIRPSQLTGVLLSRKVEDPFGEGYSVQLADGRVQVNLVKRWLDDAIRVETEEQLQLDQRRHLLVTYDGSRVAAGVRVYLDGKPAKLRILLDDLNQSFATNRPFRVGSGVSDVRLHPRTLNELDAQVAAVPESIADILAKPPAARSAAQTEKLRRYYLHHHAPKYLREEFNHLDALHELRRHWVEHVIPTTMVMREMPQPRKTFVLKRGQYDQPGEPVGPGVPEVLSLWRHQPNRLGLARWLVEAENPLTARVAVNRLWQMLFGQGLVRTVEDFGAQGDWPTHPELLDWLAVDFRESGWRVKRLLRLIVTSQTYQQSSRSEPEAVKRDPENRLLARASRLRLSAEMIRDQALAASGLLVERLGGPSVKPYQPEGLWRELADAEYVRDRGEALYRRGLYVFWKRTVAPPNFVTFDAAGRESCQVRETRTNTPLQALILLNDVTYVEAARVLAERLLEKPGHDEERLTELVRRVLARKPHANELAVLQAALTRHRHHYRNDIESARRLVRTGEAALNDRLDVVELAALTAVAGVVLNLDEAITRE